MQQMRALVAVSLTATLAVIGLAMGCSGGGGGATGPGSVAAIVVTPDSVSLIAGATQALTAQPQDASGKPVAGATIVWASADTTIATVDTTGTVAARAPGSVRIAASAQGVSGYAKITVTARPVASVAISPNPAAVPLNASAILTATLKDGRGDTLAGQSVTWSSNSSNVSVTASTGQTQVVTGNAAGSATITATAASGVSGTVTVTVTNPVAFIQVTPYPIRVRTTYTVQATAQAEDANQTVLSGVTFAWTTKSGGTIANVNSTTGLVSGVAAGSDSVIATAGGKHGSAPVTVLADSVKTVTVTPATATIASTQTQTLTASVTDSTGIVLPAAVAWTSSPSGRVSATSGLTTIVTPQPGDTTGGIVVTATSEGKTGHSTITVSPSTVDSISLSPSPVTMTVGDSPLAITATLKDANGNPLTNRPLAWSSNNTNVATVTGGHETGTVAAVAAGTAIITASSSDGASAADTITVQNPPAPGTPTGVNATLNSGTIRVQWSSVSGATSYKVFRGTSAGGEGGTPVATPSTNSFNDNTVAAGGTYYYTVAACNLVNICSSQSSEASATLPPAAPTGVTPAVVSGPAIQVTWTAASGATSYKIFRGASSGGEGGTPIATQSASPYTDNTGSAGGTYYYYVEACNTGGCSGNSSEVSATLPPPAPTDLLATASGTPGGGISLTWTATTGVNYNILRGTSPGGESQIATGVPGSPYADTDPSLVSTTTYYYVIMACDTGGCSVNSNESSAAAP